MLNDHAKRAKEGQEKKEEGEKGRTRPEEVILKMRADQRDLQDLK